MFLADSQMDMAAVDWAYQLGIRQDAANYGRAEQWAPAVLITIQSTRLCSQF